MPGGVWGIDIGQCGLKALHCTMASDGESIQADAFDFIEYPKILSQPDADPEQLVRDALKQFLSRNNVRGAKVAISVSGQSGLARFIKLPPVESKKIPDIVKYEARQQIPFALEDVVWDYQQMPGGSEEDGFTLETEVGLFAMKRDQVFRAIRPLVDAELEIDAIQLTPLCIYNMVAFDVLNGSSNGFDADSPPESVVVLSMGTDTTDLVLTNGFRVWQRSIPLGGNHFTKQLMKEMKLTFAKAEQLKRNAREAEDPKAVFQAMRSVFGDLVTEVQRSIGYFQNIDRSAKIGRIVMLGNAAKLPGLPQYLGKNLSHEVVHFESFKRLTGSSVTSAPAFKDNLLSFAVCYGLCLQGLGQAKLSTNLVPREIIVQRLIRRKKPWAAAVVSVLLLACALNFFFRWNAWRWVHPGPLDSSGMPTVGSWEWAKVAADKLQRESNGFISEDGQLEEKLQRLDELGEEAVATTDERLLWPELWKALNEALPRDPDIMNGKIGSLKERPPEERLELYIEHVESQYFTDPSGWFTKDVKTKYQETLEAKKLVAAQATRVGDAAAPGGAGDAQVPSSPPTEEDSDSASAASADTYGFNGATDGDSTVDSLPPPEGPGWVIELKLRHFHNKTGEGLRGALYVQSEFLAKLDSPTETVTLPVVGTDNVARTDSFTFNELGIQYPIIVDERVETVDLPNPEYVPAPTGAEGTRSGFGTGSATPASTSNAEPAFVKTTGCDCRVQFWWKPTPVSERMKRRQELQQQAADSLAASSGTATQGP